MTRIRRLTALAIAAALIAPVTAADARAGDIDQSFGDDGIARDRLEGSWGYDVAVDSDGAILVAGEGGGDLVVARFTRSGARDRTFGRRGSATVGLGKVPSQDSDRASSRGRAMSPTHEVHIFAGPGSKISVVALGQSQLGRRIVAARFTAEGRVDESFGDDGTLIVDPRPDRDTVDAYLAGTALLDDGSLVVGGGTREEASAPEDEPITVTDTAAFVAKYDVDGRLDATFGNDGVVWLPSGGSACCAPRPVPSSVGLSSGWSELGAGPNGEIIVAGSASLPGELEGTAVWLMRFLPDGVVDPTFGGGGSTVLEIPIRSLTAMEVHVDGYYLAGPGNGRWVVARVGSDGVLDASFGSGGIAVIPGVGPISHGPTVGPSALGVHRGRLWAIGPGWGTGVPFAVISDRDRLVARLTKSGQPDERFGSHGLAWLPRRRVYNVGHGIDFQGKRRALIAATVQGGDLDLGVLALKA